MIFSFKKKAVLLLTLSFTLCMFGVNAVPAMAETVTLTPDSYTFIEKHDCYGVEEDTYYFAINHNSIVHVYFTFSNFHNESPSIEGELELYDSNHVLIDKYKTDLSGDYYSRVDSKTILPKGDYSLSIKVVSNSEDDYDVHLSAYASTTFDGTDYQVLVPSNTSIDKACSISLDKTIAGMFTNWYGELNENRYYSKRYYKFELNEPLNVRFIGSPYYGEEKISLVDTNGNTIKSATSPYNAGSDYYESFGLDCGRLDKGTHYICVELTEKPKYENKLYNNTYEVKIKSGREMYRMYNPYTGEHLYTANTNERETMVGNGWNYEGVMWYAPVKTNNPVYRLYNPYNGDHHYTISNDEYEKLANSGWNKEGVSFYSTAVAFEDARHPVYEGKNISRLFNKYNTKQGAHHYTANQDEVTALQLQGWDYEGYAWGGIDWESNY